MNKLATMHQVECMELAALNSKIEQRRMQERMERAEAMAIRAEAKRKAEKARHEKEMNGLLYGLTAFSCLVATVSCIFTAPWWTAVAPMVLAVFTLRKAGW